jgi:sugar lactone lactonase YvrE
MDREGNLYFSDLDHLGVNRRSADGRISIVIRDPRLHWVDAPAIDGAGDLWLPVPQIDRAAAFNHGLSQVRWPIQLFRLQLTAAAGPDSSRVPAR